MPKFFRSSRRPRVVIAGTPTIDVLRHLDWLKRLRRNRGRDLDEGGVPVEPDKPKNLSGGAAATLEFDD